jgi:hypothetical protein
MFSVLNFIGDIGSAIIDNPKNAVIIAVVIVLIGLSGYAGYWYRGATAVQGDAIIRIEDEPLTMDRIVDTSEPSSTTLSPPSESVDTTCAVLPTFITRRDTVIEERGRLISIPGTNLESTAPTEFSVPELQLQRGWLALPVVGGSPAVRVTKDMTTVQAFDPVDGSGITFRYEHPKDRWHLGALSRISGLGLQGKDFQLYGTLGGYIGYKNIRVEGGYKISRLEEMRGFTVSLGWYPSLISF